MSEKKNDRGSYEDIIELPHHVSKAHPQMSTENRAAQFAPFAALTGYEDAVHETARLTQERSELEEDRKEELNERLQLIQKNISCHPEVHITYFKKDEKKTGGTYFTVIGKIKKIDPYKQAIVLQDQSEIPIEDIFDIQM